MKTENDVKNLITKIDSFKKDHEMDLSSDEDLSIAIMNLVSIEEHLFYTAQKTNNNVYLGLLKEVREMRVDLLKKIIKEYEGEVWCISKHLLAASMRVMEVGTKSLGKGNMTEANEMFNKAYDLYSMFWALNLKLINPDDIKGIDVSKIKREDNISLNNDITNNKGLMSKIKDVLKKAIDCCKE